MQSALYFQLGIANEGLSGVLTKCRTAEVCRHDSLVIRLELSRVLVPGLDLTRGHFSLAGRCPVPAIRCRRLGLTMFCFCVVFFCSERAAGLPHDFCFFKLGAPLMYTL